MGIWGEITLLNGESYEWEQGWLEDESLFGAQPIFRCELLDLKPCTGPHISIYSW